MSRFPLGGTLLWLALLVGGLVAVSVIGEPVGVAGAQGEAHYRTFGPGSGKIVEVELDAVETTQEIGDREAYRVWSFGGTAPAPVIRVTEGDTVRFTLNNETRVNLSHSIDFHAAQTPWDKNYQPVPPGESLTFDWVARFPGVFMYHCGVDPVLHHIANGMYGAILVEPKTGLEPAREYVLAASEFYAGAKPVKGALEGEPALMEAAEPTHVVFNGVANQYIDEPLKARPNELIRIWVMNAGPTLTTAFHVIGALFDHVYPDGNPTTPMNGIQTWNVPPGGGAMFELRIPDEGMYPFVTHSFAYTGRGSVGLLQVTADASARPESYPRMATPFDGGLTQISGTVDLGDQPAPPPDEEDDQADQGASQDVSLEATITAFTPSEVEVQEGQVGVSITNLDPTPHDFTIDELEVKEVFDAEETVSFSFEATPGEYQFYCSIPGHREAGMEGTLTVVPSGGH